MNRPFMARDTRLGTASRWATGGRVIVYLVMLRVVFVVWQKGPEPLNILVLVIPGVLFLIDGDLSESIGGTRPAVRGRVRATGGVALAALLSAVGIASFAQTELDHSYFRPVAVAVIVFAAALMVQSIRRATDSLTTGLER